MKKIIAVLTVFIFSVVVFACFTSSGLNAATTFQKVDFINAEVNTQTLNLRQGASTDYPIVCELKKGQGVKVFGKIGDWFAVYDENTGFTGMVSSKYIKQSKDQPTPTNTGNQASATPTPGTSKTAAKATPPTASATPAKANTTAVVTQMDTEEQQVLDMINNARTKEGLTAYKTDNTLNRVAKLKVKDMVDNKYFSHTSPIYGSPFDMMKQFGISFKSAGESIAGNKSLVDAVNAWMSADEHKKNLLSTKFNYASVGVLNSDEYGKIIVAEFIAK